MDAKRAMVFDVLILKALKIKKAAPPMIRAAKKIFMIFRRLALKPKASFFLDRLLKSSPAVIMAEILVAKANPPIPKNLDKIIFRIILMITPIIALMVGVFVSL